MNKFNYSLVDKALAHEEEMRERFTHESLQSVKDTEVYGPRWVESNKNNLDGTTVTLIDGNSVSCLLNEKMVGKVAILNYASYTSPGGLYLKGSTAQEEDLCHKSNLYSILSSPDLSYYYDWNRRNMYKCLYEDRALYIPNVVFEAKGGYKYCDVITCAAPNWNSASLYHGATREENQEVFARRIKFMIDVAYKNSVDTLICGAWGCGVFGQDPEFVAKEIVEHCRYLKNIYFAIPDMYSNNYKAFERVMERK